MEIKTSPVTLFSSGLKETKVEDVPKVQESGAVRQKDRVVKNSLEDALLPFLRVSQIFGVLPLSGLWIKSTKNSARLIQFKWLSPSTFVAILFTVVGVIEVALAFQTVAELGLGLKTTGAFEFVTICLFIYVLLFKMSRDWCNIMDKTRQCERNFLQDMYANKESKNFSRTIRTLFTILLIGSVAEHMAYKGQAFNQTYQIISACNVTQDYVVHYYTHSSPKIFQMFHIRKWMIFFIETLGFTFAWNCLDIFITLMAKSLTIRFNQLHWFIKKNKHENFSIEMWRKVREDVLSLLELLSCYDAKLSALVLVSCTNNLYFVCMQIFYSFKPMSSDFFRFYFYFSLVFVVFRALTMMFTAAALHEIAKRLVSLMYEIPSSHWCLELERLNEVLTSDIISLSGHKFFFLTRGLIMAMLGKIIIYELVLLDKDDEDGDGDGPIVNQTDMCRVSFLKQ